MTWCVLIEELTTVGLREWRQWDLTGVEEAGEERSDAVQLAAKLSRHHRPHHPMNERKRTRYRTADGWVVAVTGSTSEFHFRLTIAERVIDLPRNRR